MAVGRELLEKAAGIYLQKMKLQERQWTMIWTTKSESKYAD